MATPEPLTPPDCNLQDFQFMPLDVLRLRDSELASNETPEACWAAVLLWCAAWHQVPAGSIPNDEQWIAKQAGYARRGRIDKEWNDVRPGALRGWVECSDGRLYHPVVAERVQDVLAERQRRGGYQRFKEAVLALHGNRCVYCGANSDITLDHVVPRSRGGADSIENLVPACRSCNSAKGARTPEEWRP